MGAGRHPGATPGPGEAPEFQEALHPEPVPGIRLQQLFQAVVVDLGAGERPADVLGDVIVAEAHRVGVAEGPLRHLGGRPPPDPRHRLQPGPRVRTRYGSQPTQALGHPAYSLDGVCSREIDWGTEELP
ncbi:MAG TPA: hypothetical protein PKC73_03925 [Dermatophilaceae bacterium]|nr:hypothetical protein [Dermatophilaceae bacterium]